VIYSKQDYFIVLLSKSYFTISTKSYQVVSLSSKNSKIYYNWLWLIFKKSFILDITFEILLDKLNINLQSFSPWILSKKMWWRRRESCLNFQTYSRHTYPIIVLYDLNFISKLICLRMNIFSSQTNLFKKFISKT
jgi:hypothetical protein